jgi:hypothetical protein
MTKGIDITFEDILYNFTSFMTMSRSSLGKPFRVAKEIDLGMMQALIKACTRPRALVVTFNCEPSHYKSFSFFTFE